MLASVGRLDDALEQALRAVEIDPGSAVINNRVAITYTWLDDSKHAHEYFRRSLDLGASGTVQFLAYALLLARDGQLEEAFELTNLEARNAGVIGDWIAPVFDALADPAKAAAAIAALDRTAATGALPAQVDLTARTMLGDIDGAMRVAELLDAPGEAFEMDLLFIPELRPLRQHPDFLPLLERLGVTAYWSASGCVWLRDEVRCGD
jgi:tetratricopeptide (TPR) repeat protein